MTKRRMIGWSLLMVFLLCALPMPQTQAVEQSPLMPRPLVFHSQVRCAEAVVSAAVVPLRRPSTTLPAVFLHEGTTACVTEVALSRLVCMERAYRPTVQVLAKNHPLIGPPICL